MPEIERGSLAIGEPHPMAKDALAFIITRSTVIEIEALASCAIEGNRAAKICLETLRRIREGKPVSDRYVLGLAWMIQSMAKEK